MAVKLITTIRRYVGATADSKPTSVPIGSTYLDRQTGILYVTYDGTNWAEWDRMTQLAAGEDHVGEVGGAAAKLTASITRPTGATPYSALDVCAAATIAVTGTASGSGGHVRLAVAAHSIVTGQAVTIAAVGGTVEANGNWIATYVDSTHIEIPVAYINAWTSAGTIQPMITLLGVGRINGGSIWIDGFRRCTNDPNDIVAHRLWFYILQPTQPADNAVFTLLWANVLKRAKYVDLPAMATEGAGSDCMMSENITDRLHIQCDVNDMALFVIDEVRAAYTPTTATLVDYIFNVSKD